MLNGINNENNNLNNLNLLNTQLTEQTEATGATNPIEGSKVNPYEKDKNYLVDETIMNTFDSKISSVVNEIQSLYKKRI